MNILQYVCIFIERTFISVLKIITKQGIACRVKKTNFIKYLASITDYYSRKIFLTVS